ncbi:zinc finger BED domain-containing protein 4-like [Entelurus aequoreus]|uniref:zinc finger BED domain-containing protein 4-like n=1 Tax=Entelurus aequoreus TaxID=161455 RepID=UPI002B1CEB5C|nr:zinc finger BED domain-containing protein 4-like [Entelurus aequoreus]
MRLIHFVLPASLSGEESGGDSELNDAAIGEAVANETTTPVADERMVAPSAGPPERMVAPSAATRKQMLDEALLNFIVKDCQPLSIVESEGFWELVQVLEPSYVLPTRKTIKKILVKKYEEEWERVKLEVQQAVAVSITADMWTSVNMEAYLALTCHYINDNLQLCTSVLGVQYFPQSHTADNLAQVKRDMMADWAITNEVKCFVTDAAPNMIASTRQLQIRHSICIAHSLNLLVRKSCDQIPTLASIRHKARHIVTYFRSSTTAKEKLAQVQQQMGRPTLKLINEVATRWNSTYEMLSRLHDEKESVWVSLASLKTDLTPLTADEFDIVGETLIVLAPFHPATVELSEERRVSGSKAYLPTLPVLRVDSRNSAPLPITSRKKFSPDKLPEFSRSWRPHPLQLHADLSGDSGDSLFSRPLSHDINSVPAQ